MTIDAPQRSTTPDFLTEIEAAETLGITRRRLQYIRDTGRITYYAMRPPLYDRKDVEEFRESEAKSAAESAAWKAECQLRAAEKRAKRQSRIAGTASKSG